MKRYVFRYLASLALMCAPVLAFAQVEGNPDNMCRGGLYTRDDGGFQVGQITGAKDARAYFYGDMSDDCPNAGEKCKEKSYLIPGDQLIVSRRFGDYICGYFVSKKGRATVGWLRTASVALVKTDANPSPSIWVGTWKDGEQSLNIKRGSKPSTLAVNGDAVWGSGDRVHVGEVAAEAVPRGNILKLQDKENDSCNVTLRLFGDFLVVNDNSQCGGANVSFDGVYRK